MDKPQTQPTSWAQIAQGMASDIRAGFVEVTRHGMAVLGMAVLALLILFAARPELQTAASDVVLGWIQSPQDDDAALADPGASRSTALAIQALSPEQLAVTQWLSRKYRISPEPLAAMVTEAWKVGERTQVPSTLILAVIAAESSFNPFAQRSSHNQGLMQIDRQTQLDALSRFGGPLSVYDPLTNLRVGSRLLKSAIVQAGSVEDGWRAHAQASAQAADPGYTERVLAEYKFLEGLVQTQTAGVSAPSPSASPSP